MFYFKKKTNSLSVDLDSVKTKYPVNQNHIFQVIKHKGKF